MSLPARKFEVKEVMADPAALEERVEHLQKDVTELRKDVRRLDDKIDGVRKEVADQRTELTAAICGVETRLTAALGAMQVRLITWMVGTALTGVLIALGAARLMK